MHELSLCRAIANTVERHADGRRVKLVTLRIGRLRQVVPETLNFYFGFVSQGTLCEGAVLEQEHVPVLVRWGDCAREWELDLPVFRCADCGSSDVALLTGDEFEVESIEVEEPQCIAQRGGSQRTRSTRTTRLPLRTAPISTAPS